MYGPAFNSAVDLFEWTGLCACEIKVTEKRPSTPVTLGKPLLLADVITRVGFRVNQKSDGTFHFHQAEDEDRLVTFELFAVRNYDGTGKVVGRTYTQKIPPA